MPSAPDIQRELRQLGSREAASHAQRFFKTGPGQYGEGDLFLGIRVPVLRQTARENSALRLEETCLLLQSAFHEERLLALFILVEKFGRAAEEGRKAIYDLYLKNTPYINNLDLVDCSAEHIVGAYLQDKNRAPLYDLVRAASLWERRIGVMATFHFIKQNDFNDTLKISATLMNDKEDLIHKATGWMLREIGKREIAVLEDFLWLHLRVMPRTMLRYAIEKFPEERRQRFLKGTPP